MSKSSEANFIGETLLIWDGIDSMPPEAEAAVLWRSYKNRSNTTSIPQLVECNAEQLRARYLAWVYDLGETPVRDSRLLDQLALRPGFSYWWMTLIAEKCNFEKSPLIDEAIRFMAFEEWAQVQQIAGIELATANAVLAECMRVWCEKKAMPFKLRVLQVTQTQVSWLRRAFSWLPLAVQALVWLIRYLWLGWPLRDVGRKAWRNAPGRVTFVSYLFNLDPAATAQGRFESRYWGHLPEELQKDACETNWLHIYVNDALLPTAKRAAEVLHSWNEAQQGLQRHVALDTFLGPALVLRTLRDWGRLMRVAMQLRRWSPTQHRDSHLLPLVVEDWNKSIFGIPALKSLLYLNLLQVALIELPPQDRGVYLQENQGWELGLVYAWKDAGHGKMIGCPHSTIRFWDLRYFFDPRSYHRTGKNDLPLPYQVACNGPAMRQALESAGYPPQDLVDVEALRYLQLSCLRTRAPQDAAPRTGLRVLVLGDYRMENTQRQMHMLEQALPLLKGYVTWVVKPHPACPIYAEDYPRMAMQISMKPIAELIGACDVVYSSAVTSGAVDAYCAGVPTVVLLDPNTLNLSPLRGCAGVFFSSTPEELAKVLASAGACLGNAGGRTEFFTLDPQVPRWRAVLHNSASLK